LIKLRLFLIALHDDLFLLDYKVLKMIGRRAGNTFDLDDSYSLGEAESCGESDRELAIIYSGKCGPTQYKALNREKLRRELVAHKIIHPKPTAQDRLEELMLRPRRQTHSRGHEVIVAIGSILYT
jgi:hypothetical protein